MIEDRTILPGFVVNLSELVRDMVIGVVRAVCVGSPNYCMRSST